MKKVFFFLTMLFLSDSMIKCYTDYEEIIPADDVMGEWDGNYIYKGNVRSKTTGEDQEVLIESIIYDNVEYIVTHTNDYLYNDDYILLLLNTISNNNEFTFFVEYSIIEQNYEIIYQFDSMIKFVNNVENEYLFIKTNNSELLKYDYKSKRIIDEITNIDKFCFISKDILIIHQNNMIKYTYCNQINFIDIASSNKDNYYKLVDNRYIRITNEKAHFSTLLDRYIYYINLAYYDIKLNTYIKLIDETEKKEVSLINDYYFIIGMSNNYDYFSNIIEYNSKQPVVLTKYLITKNILYKIDYENKIYDEIYEFPDKKVDYTRGVIKNNTYYIYSSSVDFGSKNKPGGVINKDYKLDLDTLKLNKYVKEEKEIEYKVNTIDFGKYQYYITTKPYGGFLSKNYGYYLYRKDIETQEEKVMQFFAFENEMLIGTRYSSYLWEDLESIDFNEKYYLILNY